MLERRGAFLRHLRRLTPREAVSSRKRITKAVFLLGIGWAGFERHLLSAESVSKVRKAMLARGSSPAVNNTLEDLRGLARAGCEMEEIPAEVLAAIEAVPIVPDPKLMIHSGVATYPADRSAPSRLSENHRYRRFSPSRPPQ